MNKKTVKTIIVCAILIVICIIGLLVYNNIFADSNNNRFENADKYKFTSKEEKSIKDVFNDISEIESVNVRANNKIISIIVTLKEDIDFNKIKELANETITSIDEKNLEYYDLEMFVKSKNNESEVYPQIGYKFKNNTEFSW